MSKGSAPIRMSRNDRLIVCVPGASMQVLAIHGLTSLSPKPLIPASVWIATMKLSCAEEVSVLSKLGASRT
jgi:hypothetical protein